MSRNYFILIITPLLLPLMFISCAKSGSGKEAEAAEVIPDSIVEMRYDQIKLAGIDTGSIDMRYISSTLKVSGKVAVPPQNFVTVSAPLGGFIKTTNLIPGNHVSKGQTLAVIENPEFVNLEESYLETKNKLEFAEAEFRRHTELYKEEVYSEMNLQQVTTDYKTLRVQLSALEQKLALIGLDPKMMKEDNISRTVTLTSPIDGFVKTVNVNAGKSVSSTDVLFEILNTDKLYLELTLFEKDASKVSDGQKVRFFINNEIEQHDAQVYQTGRSVDADKTYKVYALVQSGCQNVLPGMYVNATIELSGKKVAAIPSDAVVSFDDKDYIFTYLKNKQEKGIDFTEYSIIEVQKGVTEGGYTEIILPSGFDISKAKVVVKGAYNLLSAKKNAGEMAC
jgi:membrane fusion protein, heavy metal efflux system